MLLNFLLYDIFIDLTRQFALVDNGGGCLHDGGVGIDGALSVDAVGGVVGRGLRQLEGIISPAHWPAVGQSLAEINA